MNMPAQDAADLLLRLIVDRTIVQAVTLFELRLGEEEQQENGYRGDDHPSL